MAGILKVDQVQSDSNLAFAIAGSNVAFMNATSLQMVGSNVSLAGTNVITNGKLVTAAQPIGAVLQVVSIPKTDVFSMSGSGTATAITGLSASITPTSATSKILIFGQVTGSYSSTTYGWNILIYKGGSVITGATGDTGNSQPRATSGMYHSYAYASETIPFYYLDSPATTSSITYAIYTFQEPGATFYVNRAGNVTQTDGRSANAISNITLMEIAA